MESKGRYLRVSSFSSFTVSDSPCLLIFNLFRPVGSKCMALNQTSWPDKVVRERGRTVATSGVISDGNTVYGLQLWRQYRYEVVSNPW